MCGVAKGFHTLVDVGITPLVKCHPVAGFLELGLIVPCPLVGLQTVRIEIVINVYPVKIVF